MIYFINSENIMPQPAIARIFNDKVRNWGMPNYLFISYSQYFTQRIQYKVYLHMCNWSTIFFSPNSKQVSFCTTSMLNKVGLLALRELFSSNRLWT